MVRPHPFDEVPEYIHAQIKRLMKLSGMEFAVVLHDESPDEYELQWPSRKQPFHLLRLNSSLKEHLNHVILLNASKLIRVYEMPKRERLVPKARFDGRLPPPYEEELSASLGRPPAELERQSRLLYSVLTSQLTNFPMNLRVERIINAEYPRHRKAQRRSLKHEISLLELLFVDNEREAAVKHIDLASMAMNSVYILEASDILVEDPPGIVLSGPYRDIARDLMEILRAENDPSYRGDRNVTDEWTRNLGFEGWYAWRAISQR